MSEDTATLTPPPDAGLSSGRPGAEHRAQARNGDDLITAAGSGAPITPDEAEDLLEYFVANGELPGDDKPIPCEWEIGDGKTRRKQVWLIKRIGWDDWKESEARATDRETGAIDGFVLASWIVSFGLVRPHLGPRLRKLQEADPEKAPADAAELLQRMFRKQSGTLASIGQEIRKISRLGMDQSARTLDQEVAAGEA